MSSEPEHATAEERFRAAFERLKRGAPSVLPKGTPVSQNNVAKESGCDPSALRKSRFPALIREIQEYVKMQDKAPSKNAAQVKKRQARRKQQERLDDVINQRDLAQSQMASANRRIVELVEEVKLLRAQLDSMRQEPKVFQL